MTSWETLEVERDGPLTRLWLARPEKRNALNTTALEEIVACCARLQTDFETRVVVLGGRGESFCAGADRRDPPAAKAMAEGGPRERRYAAQLGRRALVALESLEAVTIARVHGHAIGGGLCLAAACDFRIAAEGTLFHVPEVDLGIPLSWGAAPRLIHEVGPLRARELILLCERIDAGRAHDWGLVNRVVPSPALDVEVDAFVERLLAKPEVAVHMTLTQLRGYAARALLGDATEADGDLLAGAFARGPARQSFEPD